MVILGTAPDARVGSEFEGLAQLVMHISFSTLSKLPLNRMPFEDTCMLFYCN